METLEEIYIWWEGVFNYSDIINNKIDSTEYSNKATDIGITTEQSFQKRLKKRWIINESNDIDGQ